MSIGIGCFDDIIVPNNNITTKSTSYSNIDKNYEEAPETKNIVVDERGGILDFVCLGSTSHFY